MRKQIDINHVIAALNNPSAASSDFDLNPEFKLPPDRVLRPAGVLIAIGDAGVYLTKRASHLKHHPGQIAFPGGKVDETDTDVIAAALREADEEIGLDPANTEILGTLPTHETVTGFRVTPVVARVITPFAPQTDPNEVDEAFCVPLNHVLNPDRFSIESRIWRGQRRKYFTVPYGPYYIWGATARMLYGLATRITE